MKDEGPMGVRGAAPSRADRIARHTCPDFGHKAAYEPCIFRNTRIRKMRPHVSHRINPTKKIAQKNGFSTIFKFSRK